MKLLLAVLLAFVVVCVLCEHPTHDGDAGVHLDVHYNDTQADELIHSVEATINQTLSGEFGVSAGHLAEANASIHSEVNAVLNEIDSSTALGAHQLHNTLNAHLEGNVTYYSSEHTALVDELHANATVWEEHAHNASVAHATAVSHSASDEDRIHAALEVTILENEQELIAAHVVVGVAHDNVAELRTNLTGLLVEYSGNTEAIVALNTSGSALNTTTAAQIAVLVDANADLRVEIHVVATELAHAEAFADHAEEVAAHTAVDLQVVVTETNQKIEDINQDHWAGVDEVKAEISANVTHSEEKIQHVVNGFLGNATVTDVVVAGHDAGDHNVTIHFEINVPNPSETVEQEIHDNVQVAVASHIGAHLHNVTVEVHATGLKRVTWTADSQIGSSSNNNSGAGLVTFPSAMFLVVSLFVSLVHL
jgi:hypothetical protein